MTMDRRDFITLASLASLSLCVPRFLRANEPLATVGTGKIFIPIFLRGGMDGLSLIAPYNDPHYYEKRKTIAVPKPNQENGALDIDGFFGVNPRAKAFTNLFGNNCLKVLLGVGHPKNTRSHFTEQDVWETGSVYDHARSDGLLNKYLATSSNRASILRSIAFGDSLPHILRGKIQTFALQNVTELTSTKATTGAALNSLELAYQSNAQAKETKIQKTGTEILNGIKEIRAAIGTSYETKITYPNSPLAKRLKDTAWLIKSKIGLEITQIDVNGWDTHQRQGSVIGPLGNKFQDLADSLWAFYQDLENEMDNIVVMVFSEFGRTVAENGTQGTDHGWGNCVLVMGGSTPKALPTRHFLNEWPGIDDAKLNRGRDLKDTIDFRNVFAEIFTKHLGHTKPEEIIEKFSFQNLGFLT